MQLSRTLVPACLGSLIFVIAPALAAAQESVSVPAVQSAMIQADGPKKGTSGETYFNVEGKAKARYADYGVLQFDLSAAKAALDKKYGAGHYHVTGATLELMQSNAGFTANGSCNVYFTPETPTLSAMKYPYDPRSGPIKGELLATGKFVMGTSGGKTNDEGKTVGVGNGTRNAFDLFKEPHTPDHFAKQLLQGKMLTLILSEADPNVAATWAGYKPKEPLKPPTLTIKAAANAKK